MVVMSHKGQLLMVTVVALASFCCEKRIAVSNQVFHAVCR